MLGDVEGPGSLFGDDRRAGPFVEFVAVPSRIHYRLPKAVGFAMNMLK